MSKVTVLVLLVVVAFGAVAKDGQMPEPAGGSDGLPRDPRGVVAAFGMGLSFGHVELYDGADNLVDSEVGYAVNADLGYKFLPHWAVHVSFRSFSQTDRGAFIVIFPSPCVVAGPAVTWYLRAQPPTLQVTAGFGYPFDGIDSVDAEGQIGGFIGVAYRFRRLLRVELDSMLGIYDSGSTFGVSVTANVTTR